MDPLKTSDAIPPRALWPRLYLGVFLVYALFHGAATALGSDRGQAGLAVCLLVVAALVLVERFFFGCAWADVPRALGLGRSARRGLLVALGLCLLLLLVIPGFAAATGSSLSFYPGWLWLVPGLFAQAGIAEETLFRGFLFGHFRRGHSFWRAAMLSAGPFVLVHLVLFFTMPWPVALAAVLLAVVMAFPLAHLYELGGGTIWAPALVHFVVQGTIKVVAVSGERGADLPLVWMAAAAVLPFLAFLVSRRELDRTLSSLLPRQLEAGGFTEEEVQEDFDAFRRRHR